MDYSSSTLISFYLRRGLSLANLFEPGRRGTGAVGGEARLQGGGGERGSWEGRGEIVILDN